MIASKLHARPFAAGLGGVGPSAPGLRPDAWVRLLVDVEADGPLSGVQVADVELVDSTGTVVARAEPPWPLRRDTRTAGDARASWDLSEPGTVPYDGEARPGQSLRLYVHAPLDAPLASIMTALPVRFRASVRASGDPGVRVEGPIDGPWDTAGPSVPG